MGTFVLNQIPIQEVTVTYTGSGDGDFTCKDSIRSEQTCPEGEVVKGFRSDGSMICGKDEKGEGIKEEKCGYGDVVLGIKSDGSMICGSPIGYSRFNKRGCPQKQMEPRRVENAGYVHCDIPAGRHGQIVRGNCDSRKSYWRQGYCRFQCLNGTWLKIYWGCENHNREPHKHLGY
ncbi:MAG: hypothetical protein GDA46_03625 [Bdellovibrionales bacterium]|nr:hypothetical protein [Bdellovibrionales bacterium]